MIWQRMQARQGTPRSAILVVDDNESIRLLMTRILAYNGYRVLEAEDGAQALSVAESHRGPISLLVTDVSMPDLDGPALLRKLRATRPHLKVIYTSAWPRHQLLPKLDDEPLLSKPFTPEELTGVVQRTLAAIQIRLEQAWAEAFREYERQVEQTLELLESGLTPGTERSAWIERQRDAEKDAYDKYQMARLAYLEFLRGAGVLALLLALHLG